MLNGIKIKNGSEERTDGNDYFLHISAIESFAGVYPVSGQKVEYGEIYEAQKGKEARHVILVEQ